MSVLAGSAGPYVVPFRDRRGRGRRMILRLDEGGHIPPFEQVRAQLSVMIAAGLLEPGTRLPTVRELAALLDLAPGTIGRAYRELERDGLIEGRGRRGTFVVDEPPGSEPVLERRRRLEAAATSYAYSARQFGVGLEAATEALHAAFTRLAHDEHD